MTSKTCTEDEGSDHGSTFTASFPLGKEHLPASRLLTESSQNKKPSYARTIVAEAAQWRLTGDVMTPSDSEDSYTSSGGARSADFAFDPADLVLLVDDNQDMLGKNE